MTRLRWLVAVDVLIGLGALGWYTWPRPSPVEERIAALRLAVEKQRNESAFDVIAYSPEHPGQIDDLGTMPVNLLFRLPRVVDVDKRVHVDNPTHRIIHIRDWHFVPRDLFAEDVQATSKALDDLYTEHLLRVELVQIEQTVLLRCLWRHHGLRRVLVEGLTPEGMCNFTERVDAVRDLIRIWELGRQTRDEWREVHALRERVGEEPDPVMDEREKRLSAALAQPLVELLELGAVARLAELEVWPLDDEDLLARSRPGVKGDTEARAAREAAIVATAIRSGPVSVIILGGAHDLTPHIPAGCEYIVVTTSQYRKGDRRRQPP